MPGGYTGYNYRVEINDWPKLRPYIWHNLCSRHHFSVTKGFLEDMIHLCFNPRKVNFSDFGWARGAVYKGTNSKIILQYDKLGSATSERRWFRNQYPASWTAGIAKKTVWLIPWKKLKLHDALDLSDRKKEGRVELCTWVLEQLTNDLDFLQMILLLATRSFSFLVLSVSMSLWMSLKNFLTDGILIPELSLRGNCAAKVTVLEDYLWFLCLCKQLLWLSHYLKN